MDVQSIVTDYYKELLKGVETGALDASKLHLDNDIIMEGPDGHFEGREKVDKVINGLVNMVSKFEILSQYYFVSDPIDSDFISASTFIRLISKDGADSILATEDMTIKNCKITRIDFEIEQGERLV